MSVLQRIIERIGGVWELARIGCASHLRGGHRYWDWRRETAFGSDAKNVKCGTKRLSRRDRIRAVMRFGSWVYRMKRIR